MDATATLTSAAVAARVADPQQTRVKFSGSDRFVRELRRRVDAYFEQTGKSKRDCPQMYFKTAMILAWFFGAYALLMFVAMSWWLVALVAVALGVAVAAIGFNIQHDGGHRAYSDRKWINKLMSLSLDLMGGSSYLWDWKHNSFHHTYTNIHGHDDDIDMGALGRLSPHQPHYGFHRLQGIYVWALYGLIAIKWHLFDDFHNLITGRIGGHSIKRPKGADLAIFIGGKIVFFSMAFVIPMMFHSPWAVIGVYLLASFVSGVVLSVVFQLAHCVEEAEFPVPVAAPPDSAKIDNDWAVHQLETTVDFARGSRIACWFLGGLNFQVEHHLFSRICHIHYPALSKVVEDTCREFGVRYNAHKTFWSAVGSHYRFLVEMGTSPQKPAV
ncbi:MAG: acyl-CoA desaturase [Burkholderiales bacterium]|nr:acyl-CoA desaturase [Phycisphaerae bacterium]